MTLVNLAEPVFLPSKNALLIPDTMPFLEGLPDKYTTVQVRTTNGHSVSMHGCQNSVWLNQYLYNVGYNVPAPILYDGYDWAGNVPFETQRLTAALMTTRMRAFVLNDLGTGKTLATLFAVDWLRKHRYIDRVLIVAPLSTLRHVWIAEIKRRMPHLRAVVLHHNDRRKRLDILASSNWDVAIINHHGIKIICDELIEAKFDAVVIDELATFRNVSSGFWKSASAIVRHARFGWGLTGSPTPNGPWDTYGQIKLFLPKAVPRSYKRFRDMVAVEFVTGKWFPRDNANETIHNLMQPAVRFALSEVVELPPCVYIPRVVSNSTAQTNMAHALRTEMYAMHERGEVTVANAGVRVSKLMQVYSGAVYTSTKAVIDLHAKDRIDAVRDIIDSSAAKVLVFTAFRHTVDILRDQLGYQFMDPEKQIVAEAAVVHGGTTESARFAIFQNFQDPNSGLKLIVAHPRCMAHGLTLVEANTIIWYGPTLYQEDYQQANGRIVRPGQTRRQCIFHIMSSPMERRLFRVLEYRENMEDALLKLFEDHAL